MKNFIVASLSILACGTVIANDCQVAGKKLGAHYYGSTTCQQITQPALSIYGNAHLTNATFDTLNVHGNLDAKQLNTKNMLSVYGNALIKNSQLTAIKVKGNLTLQLSRASNITLSGRLNAHDSNIIGDIILTSRKSHLTDTVVNGNITIEQPLFNKAQILCLIGKTKINGNIVFNSEQGYVYKSADTTITGKITGARVSAAPCP